MAGRNRDRQRAERRRAMQEAMFEAQQRARRRRLLLVSGSAILAAAAFALVFLLLRDDEGETISADRESTTTAAPTTTVPVASAAGKPCVPAESAPPPAPRVPVKVGPPPTALVTEDLRLGNGAVVGANDTVTAHYIGVSCSTGKVFDSSWSRGVATPFSLGEVIKGWQQGIPGMKVGGQRLLGIPPDLAYGSPGKPPTIAPDETLWFVVDIIETKSG